MEISSYISFLTDEYLVYEYSYFWVTSENRDYVDADLEPNSTYVINIQGNQIGDVPIASVALNPMNQNKKGIKGKLYKEIVKKC